ncbi:MAG: hypothetical protein U9R56_04705, partial [candidate division Zixibacteria bacterium]|nr:hypothetical protein [candidate division Zixibacteria bacterium]
PTASAVISNATYVGRGAATSGQRCFELRDNTAGAYYNSVFTDHGTYGLKVEDDPAGSSFEKLQAGALKFYNNVWYGFGDGNSSNAIANANITVDAIVFHSFEPYVYWPYASACPYTGIQDNHNYLSTADVVVSTGTRTPDGSLDPRVAGAGSWFLNDGSDTWAWTDPFDADVFVGYHPDASQPDGCIDGEHYRQFKVVDYAGAFDPNADVLWIHNWTALDNYGYVASPGQMADCNCATDDEGNKPIRVIDDGDVNGWIYLSSDTVYNLDGFIYVESGDTLVIEPGTILKGNPGQAENATALVVARGGLIYAIGSECCPVIFTSIDDIVDYNDDIPLDEFGRGLWGGLILLGNAVICDSLEGQIEGIPETEPRGAYGGTDDMDSSGVLRYVSIRHGGSEIGSANEINGLTMGAVGCGTVISHIEVIHNLDDGYEWFGGSVSCDHLIAAFCGDDAFDYDECYRGGGQFWFAINSEDAGDRSGEHDGGYGDNVSACPIGTPLISNATYIGRGADQVGTQRCLEIRDAAGGAYYNSVFTEHGTYGINIEANATEPIDSRTRLIYQQLKFYNNVWYGFGNGNNSPAITNNDNTVDTILFRDFNPQHYDPTQPSATVNNQNYLSSMQVVRCISRIQDEQLDPRVYGLEYTFLNDITSPWTGWSDPTNPDPNAGYHPDYHDDPFCDIDVPCWLDMDEVTFPGAFDPDVSMADSWAAGWSFLWCGGFFGDCDPQQSCCIIPADINYDQDPTSPNIVDMVYLVNFMFNNGPEPPCMPAADVNGDGDPTSPNIVDMVYLVNFMFNSGPPPPPCH